MAANHSSTDIGAPDGLNATVSSPIAADGVPLLGHSYVLPAREGRAVRLKTGQTLTIVNSFGSQVCDFWALNSVDGDEVLSMPHVHGVVSSIYPKAGDSLVSNQRRAMFRFVSDTSPGVHDTIVAACDIYRYQQLGARGYHDNCTDNFRMALIAIGERAHHIPAPFNIWMNTPVADKGVIHWLPPVSRAGDEVKLRAVMDVIAVMSACPQDMVPINGADNLPCALAFHVD